MNKKAGADGESKLNEETRIVIENEKMQVAETVQEAIGRIDLLIDSLMIRVEEN